MDMSMNKIRGLIFFNQPAKAIKSLIKKANGKDDDTTRFQRMTDISKTQI